MESKISLIDCSPLAAPFEEISEENFRKVAKELGDAMSSLGICYLVNHGVDPKKIDHVYSLSKKFFNLDPEIKAKYKKWASREFYHGYSGPGDEVLNEEGKNSLDLREAFDASHVCWNNDKTYPNKEVPGFKSAFEDAKFQMDDIAKKLLRCIEIYYKFDDGFLLERHKNIGNLSVKSQTIVRSLHYYTLDENENFPADAIRCGEHTDWGSITLLYQDMVGGLEVKTLAGEWIEATPVKNTILLNCGNLLEIYCSGQLIAAKHRVRLRKEKSNNNKDPRQSFILFVNPDGDATVAPALPIKPGYEKYLEVEPVNAFQYFLDHMQITQY